MRKVVVNSTPIISLAKAGALDLFQKLFGLRNARKRKGQTFEQ